jgi:uncharacterized protein (DUF433 family)
MSDDKTMFPISLRDLAAATGVTTEQVLRWMDRGWIAPVAHIDGVPVFEVAWRASQNLDELPPVSVLDLTEEQVKALIGTPRAMTDHKTLWDRQMDEMLADPAEAKRHHADLARIAEEQRELAERPCASCGHIAALHAYPSSDPEDQGHCRADGCICRDGWQDAMVLYRAFEAAMGDAMEKRREMSEDAFLADPDARIRSIWSAQGISMRHITTDQETLGGTPVFAGTRVPLRNLADYVAGGDTLEEFLRQFPTVSRELVAAALAEWAEIAGKVAGGPSSDRGDTRPDIALPGSAESPEEAFEAEDGGRFAVWAAERLLHAACARLLLCRANHESTEADFAETDLREALRALDEARVAWGERHGRTDLAYAGGDEIAVWAARWGVCSADVTASIARVLSVKDGAPAAFVEPMARQTHAEHAASLLIEDGDMALAEREGFCPADLVRAREAQARLGGRERDLVELARAAHWEHTGALRDDAQTDA